MVLLIIIPMKNCYFIGNIPYFQTNPFYILMLNASRSDPSRTFDLRIIFWSEIWRNICGRAMVRCWLRDPDSSTRLLMLGVKASLFWKMSSSKICLSHARENYQQVSSGVKYGLIESSALVQHVRPKSTQFHLSSSPLNIIEWQFFGYAGKKYQPLPNLQTAGKPSRAWYQQFQPYKFLISWTLSS